MALDPWLSRPEWSLDVLGPHQAAEEAALRGAPQTIREGVVSGWRDALALLPAEVASKLTQPGDRLWLEWSARMLLWSKALGLREGTPFRRDDWAWWVARLSRWSSR